MASDCKTFVKELCQEITLVWLEHNWEYKEHLTVTIEN